MNSAYSDGQGLNCSAERIIPYILLLDKVSALELVRYWGAEGWRERDSLTWDSGNFQEAKKLQSLLF